MATNNIEETIKIFYTQFKNLPEYYELDKVRVLLKNTELKLTRKSGFNQLKIFIMIATIVSFIAILLLSPFQGKNQIQTSSVPTKQDKQISLTKTLRKTAEGITAKAFKNETKKIDTLFKFGKSPINELPVLLFFSEIPGPINDQKARFDQEPIDTIYNIQELSVFLTDKEMSRIGFVITDSSLCYINVTKFAMTSIGSCGCESLYEKQAAQHDYSKNLPKDLSFYPVFRSNGNYESLEKNFLQSRDTLVPVVFKLNRLKGTSNEVIIFWFTPHRDLFDSLPDRYQDLYEKYLHLKDNKIKYPDRSFISYPAGKLDGINFITLGKTDLENLGFRFFTDSIVSPIRKDGNQTIFIRDNSTRHDTVIQTKDGPIKFEDRGASLTRKDYKSRIEITYQKNPVDISLITNSIGEVDYIYFATNEMIGDPNMLIPILLKQDMFPVLYQDFVFWLTPNDELFNRLPSSMGNQMKDEYNELLSPDPQQQTKTTCTYFEVCKSTWHLDDLRLYPNPANSFLTIDFSSDDETSGTISLMNSAGVQIKQLIPKAEFSAGYNSFSVNLDGIVPGIYLISLTSEKGFITQRLIISR